MKEFNVKVEIRLKSVVLDPQGKTVLTALKNLGYGEVKETRIGKLVQLKIKDSNEENVREKVEQMCRELLANPVIEEFEIIIE